MKVVFLHTVAVEYAAGGAAAGGSFYGSSSLEEAGGEMFDRFLFLRAPGKVGDQTSIGLVEIQGCFPDMIFLKDQVK
ncbi:MAG: hypothetical protein JXD23_09850 [Spirochaetales bacterium]|nr:hypothetical protein [Spirochaetales bacterium]